MSLSFMLLAASCSYTARRLQMHTFLTTVIRAHHDVSIVSRSKLVCYSNLDKHTPKPVSERIGKWSILSGPPVALVQAGSY